MRIDEALTSDLGIGSKKRTMDPNDSHVDIPSAIMPSIEIIKPFSAPNLVNTDSDASFAVDYLSSKNNVAAFSDQVITLGPGLWDIYYTYAINQTIATAITINQNLIMFVQLNNGALNLNIQRVPVITMTQLVGNGRFRFLSRSSANVFVGGPATAVGDTIIQWWEFVCAKLI